MPYLYRHIRLDKNEPFYIGIGSDAGYGRSKEKSNRNKHWRNIVKSTPYDIEIVIDNLTWQEACEKEKEFIKLYGRSCLNEGPLCNITEGGDGVLGMKHSEETRKKISQDNKRPEKLIICMNNLKKMQTPESRAKALASRDYEKISKKRVSNTDYSKIKEASEKAVIQYSLDGNIIKEWKSITEACNNIINLHDSNVSRCCKLKRKEAGGFIWRYKTEKVDTIIDPVKPKNKEIIQYSMNMVKIAEYKSVMDASRHTGIFKSNITACCNKKYNQASGYIWRFKKDNSI
jgi:hypothetical protein